MTRLSSTCRTAVWAGGILFIAAIIAAAQGQTYQEWLEQNRKDFEAFKEQERKPKQPAARREASSQQSEAETHPRQMDAMDLFWDAMQKAYLPASKTTGAEQASLCRAAVTALRAAQARCGEGDGVVRAAALFYEGMCHVALEDTDSAAKSFAAVLKHEVPAGNNRATTEMLGYQLQARRYLERFKAIAISEETGEVLHVP